MREEADDRRKLDNWIEKFFRRQQARFKKKPTPPVTGSLSLMTKPTSSLVSTQPTWTRGRVLYGD